MRHINFALTLLTAAVLTACGGSETGNQELRTKFSSQVSFGDSLADLGTYNVGTVKLLGGGKYTINGNGSATNPALTGKNFTEYLAAQFGLPAPCPAQTGLDGDASLGFSVAVVNNNSCLSYAQGGARVTNPVGPGNKATGASIGQLTVPVVTQVANHLSRNGGKFKGDEVVIVIAGGNDALELLAELSVHAKEAGAAEGAKVGAQSFATNFAAQLAAGATNPAAAGPAIGGAILAASQRPGANDQTIIGAAVQAAVAQGNVAAASESVYLPMAAKAKATATAEGEAAGAKAGAAFAAAEGPKMIAAMGVAGDELAALVKTQMVGKGANYVVLNNLPDLGHAPASTKPTSPQALIIAMVDNFNAHLKAGVAGESKVLYVDLYAISHDQIKNPAPYGLSNTTQAACAANKLGTTSLACTTANTIAGDVSRYMFADDVHPTPFENSLIAKYVAEQMIVKGWL
ncbi:SGNH/GDSL hydrolase family protein [Massilia violaceinigra]|uniref:SGNH/GDSL hydrolase family protein n=1 Tax=Massilia violaceinigra TaxID=2045208 RepID=A0ABY4AA84_9BURK|nr:SGNH/GDSL hydrolase family protein [Massilia violaceinigra]UOD31512.1 SGNH/GDSL hydrolase family protein [Massilia violaceinigra]